MNHEGHCHCGAVHVWFETAIPADQIQVRSCTCSHCRRHGAKSVSDPKGSLEFRAAPGSLRRHRFGLGTVDFLSCRECGVFIGAVAEIDGRTFGVLNPVGADIQALASRDAEPHDYSDQDAAARAARRSANWTPASVVEASPNA